MHASSFDFTLPITDPTWVFFLVLCIILFAPILLNRLRIPHIVGMILAGVVIGEHGLHLLNYDSSFKLFGKVGLYYIMFLAGLEMNMEDFKQTRWKALTLGVLAFVIPMVLGFFSNIFVLKYGIISSILLASMYASHTLVAYPIVIRYGVSRQRSVSIAVGGTAVTDTFTLLVLAVISGMFKGEMSGLFWVFLILKVVLLGGVIIYTFPRIGRWFFRKFSDEIVQFVFVLAMVFLGAGLMEFVGMEGILGAFLAGLVLNRLIPHVSPLMHHLEFVGNALFIPYFLIGVGMIINVRILGHVESLKVAFVMTTMALTSKWIASWATQKIFRMRAVERELMFGLSNAQAAATLAAVLVGYNILLPDGSRLLNDEVLNGTILLILLTCIISSFTTERAAKRLAVEEAHPDDLTQRKEEPERLLIPLSNPDTIEYLMNLALVLKDSKKKHNLVALTVINDNNDSPTLELAAKRNLEKAALVSAAANVSLQTVSRYDLNIASGIIHTVKEYDITDILIGLHHKANLVDSFFGYLAENLLKGVRRQVMIAKLLIPVNTIRRVNVAVPPKAELEAGFVKWVVQLARMSGMLGCSMHFFCDERTLGYIQCLIKKHHPGLSVHYSVMEVWDDLLSMSGQVSYDHLWVVVSARRGSISYDTAFERLPIELGRYFANTSLLMIYPDQCGEPHDLISFSAPRADSEPQSYEKMCKWMYNKLKRN